MAQRIGKWQAADAIAFKAGVSSPDENLQLSNVVVPTVELPFTPSPHTSGRLPLFGGTQQGGVGGRFSQVGVFASMEDRIYLNHEIWVNNNTAANLLLNFHREDNPVVGITIDQDYVPMFVSNDAQQTISFQDGPAVCRAADVAGARGTLLNFRPFACAPGLQKYAVPFIVAGGVFWVSQSVAAVTMEVFFVGEVIPVVDRQARR